MQHDTETERAQRKLKMHKRIDAYATARVAIAEYLLAYGVREERAYGAAADLLNEEINEVIDTDGDGS